MNWLDIVFGLILFVSMAMSFRQGFTREIASLIASVLALVCGMWFYTVVGGWVEPYVGSRRGANLIGFFLVVAAIMILGAIVGLIVSRLLRTIGLSFVDRLLGAVFGLVRGAFLCIAMLTALTAFGPHADSGSTPGSVVHSRVAPWLLNSRIAPWLIEASRVGVAIAPMELKQSFRKYYAEVKEMWQHRTATKTDKDS